MTTQAQSTLTETDYLWARDSFALCNLLDKGGLYHQPGTKEALEALNPGDEHTIIQEISASECWVKESDEYYIRETAYALRSKGVPFSQIQVLAIGGSLLEYTQDAEKLSQIGKMLMPVESLVAPRAFDAWEDNLTYELSLKEAVEIAQLIIAVLEPCDRVRATIALEGLRKRVGMGEYNWNNKFLKEVRLKLERYLAQSGYELNQVSSLVDGLIEQDLHGAELRQKLQEISFQSGWHINELYQLHKEKLEDIEREDARDYIHKQLEDLINANKVNLNLNDFFHHNLAKPLLHLAYRLSLKPEMYLTVLLTVTSTLFHPSTKIWLSEEDDFEQPPNLYSAIIAPSSQKKSPVLKAIATKPLRTLQKEAEQEFKSKHKEWKREMEEWSKDNSPDKGEAPEEPKRTIHYFTKATGEGLEYQAARQPNQGMLYLSDELAGIINSQNQYRRGKGSDKQDFLSYYDGIGHVTLRAAEGVKSESDTILLGILGAIQPKVIQGLLKDCEDSDGNWARFLFVNQPAVAAQLHPDGGKIDLTRLLTDLYRKIKELPPTEYTLSREAFKIYQQAYNRYEQNRVTDPLGGMQSVWGKSEGRVGRLALNLHVINALAANQTPSEVIEAETIQKAIALTDYYAMQVKAMYTEFSDSDALAPYLAKVIELSLKASSGDGWLKARDVCLSTTKSKRPTPEKVREWFSELVTHGKGEVKGSGRKLQFRAFTEKDKPITDKVDDKGDKLSTTQTTEYQYFQDLVDKIDKLDNSHKSFGKASPVNQAGNKAEDSVDEPPKMEKVDFSYESSTSSTNPSSPELASDSFVDMEPTNRSTNSESSTKQEYTEEDFKEIADALFWCPDVETLEDLRQAWKPEHLQEACKRLTPKRRAIIKQWVLELNKRITPGDVCFYIGDDVALLRVCRQHPLNVLSVNGDVAIVKAERWADGITREINVGDLKKQ